MEWYMKAEMFVLFYCSCVLLLASTTAETLSVISVESSRGHEHKIQVRSAPGSISVDELLEKYGQNGQMNLTQLQQFLKTIGVPATNEMAKQSCFSSRYFYGMYSGNDGNVNKTDFVDLCPAVLYQLSKKECHVSSNEEEKKFEDDGKGKTDPRKAWGYGVLFVTIICVLCLAGALVVPFMDKRSYKIVLMFMVSLAVGVLFGGSIFHLIPSMFGFSEDDPGRNSFMGKCATIVGGLYLFFILEYIMKLKVQFKALNKQPAAADIGGQQRGNSKDGVFTVYSNNYLAGLENHGVDTNDVDTNGIDTNGVDTNGIDTNGVDTNGVVDVVTKPGEKKRITTVAWMIVIGDGLHNFIDGLAIGASFSTSIESGISTSLAVMAEELPHELGDFAILLSSGFTYKQAMLANFMSACMCYIGLVVGIILGFKTTAVKYIKGIAAGMFIYISLVDMLPESLAMTRALSGNSKSRSIAMLLVQNFAILLGFTVMFILALDFATITI